MFVHQFDLAYYANSFLRGTVSGGWGDIHNKKWEDDTTKGQEFTNHTWLSRIGQGGDTFNKKNLSGAYMILVGHGIKRINGNTRFDIFMHALASARNSEYHNITVLIARHVMLSNNDLQTISAYSRHFPPRSRYDVSHVTNVDKVGGL